MATGKTEVVVDETLYNRQIYVMGLDAQKKVAEAHVLIIGLRGLGVEIAKNVILAGVKAVTLFDSNKVEPADLGSNFYLTKSDIGQRRDVACVGKLAELNKYVKVGITESLSENIVASGGYQIVVATETPIQQQVALDTFCRSRGIKFISADVRGLFTSVFVDLGEEHVATDLNGEQPLRGLVVDITNGNPGVVTVYDEKRHGLEDGDYVTFEEVQGMTELNGSAPRPVKVLTPFSFSIEDTSKYHEYTGTKGYFQQVKQPKKFKFDPLAKLVKSPNILNDPLGDLVPLHCLYVALSEFQAANSGRLPSPSSGEDTQQLLELAKKVGASLDSPREFPSDAKYFHLARCSGSIMSPIAAFAGGIVGQEVLKAVSGKFTPLIQQLYFVSSEVLPNPADLNQYAPEQSRYDAQIAVLGKALNKRVQELTVFLVGAGAIGCEMLKNFALMGVGTQGRGKIYVTDMDNIEKTNLSRQFLFRESDIGSLKSTVAAREAKKMNPDLRIEAQSLRVSPQTEDVYDDAFWESLDVVITALDNVEARLYLDARCVQFQKPMIDSGTLGTKGNTQVVIPFLTESYASSRDPPEESIPLCTLKNFPNKIEHTIQWARDLFEGLFKQGVDETNSYLTNPKYLQEVSSQSTQFQSIQTVHSYLITERPQKYDDCVAWARLRFETEFHNNIVQLLFAFPPDAKTEAGTPFWSGPKRAPTPLKFDVQDPLHLEFVYTAANLRAFNYGIKIENPEYCKRAVSQVKVPTWKPNAAVKIAANENEQKEIDANSSVDQQDEKLRELVAALPQPKSLGNFRLSAAEFEKDNPTNFHIDFITAASNCRARNYSIHEASKHDTKGIAGKIIPAIATTTALVTGLVCVEIYKLLQEKKLEDFKNTYVNLALPLITSSDPIAPATTTTTIKTGPWKWSLWDRIDVAIGDVTLQQFLDWFQEQYGLEINMLSYGKSVLFYTFAPKKNIKERLAMPVSKVVELVTKEAIPTKERFIRLEVCVNNEAGEDVDLPPVRFLLRK